MRARDRVDLGARRILALERIEALVRQRALDRAQPVRPLGMPGRA